MRLSNFLQGIEILRKHYEDQDGFHIAAEHDQFYLYPTNTPLTDDEFAEVKKLGWFQPEVDGEEYNQSEGWSCYT